MNMLSAFHDWFLTSEATSAIVGTFLGRLLDFLDDDSLRVPALRALDCFSNDHEVERHRDEEILEVQVDDALDGRERLRAVDSEYV
jgi:hypothetical protein